MSWDEVKDEKEGYVRVRKSGDRALVGRLRKANDDPEAKGYIELNKDDLGGMGGGGGPHSHSEYASKTHTHEDLVYDDSDLTARVSATESKNTQQDQRLGSLEVKQSVNADDITELFALSETKADANHTHDGVGGDGYDDTELKKRLDDDEAVIDDLSKRLDVDESNISKNRQKIDNIQNSINDINNNKLPGKADVDHTHDSEGGGESYDDSWIQPALDSKSDTTHTHDAVDLTHNHDGEYASAVHGHDEFMVLQNQINGKSDEDHIHDVAVFDPTPLEEKDAEQDDRLDKIDLEQEEQNARLDALEAGEAGEGVVVAVSTWKRNDNAAVSGGMIGVANFNNVTSIFLSRNDITHQPFDFSEIEVGNVLTITNTNNTDARGTYIVTSLEDKGGYWNFRVDTIEGTGITQMNDFIEFSFAAPGEEEAAEHEHEGMVVSDSVTSIVRLSQADFDALSDKDSSTLYLVV